MGFSHAYGTALPKEEVKQIDDLLDQIDFQDIRH